MSAERARLSAALAAAARGHGSLMLLSGEAGVGKTRLAEEVLAGTDARGWSAAQRCRPARHTDPSAAAFREYLRAAPDGLWVRAVRNRLALLLPELGPAEPSADRATLVEAIRCGLAARVASAPAARPARRPAVVGRGDPRAAGRPGAPAAASCRCSSSPRTARTSSRAPTRCAACATICAGTGRWRRSTSSRWTDGDRGTGGAARADHPRPAAAPGPCSTRTGGPPFLRRGADRGAAGGRAAAPPSPAGLELEGERRGARCRGPVRDAVLVRTAGSRDDAPGGGRGGRGAGPRFELGLVAESERGRPRRAARRGPDRRDRAGVAAAFRHPLARERSRGHPWLRRRALHRRLAEELRARRRRPGGETAGALDRRPRSRCARSTRWSRRSASGARVHAYRDGDRPRPRRRSSSGPRASAAPSASPSLEEHARCAELAGDLAEAARAQREVVGARRVEGGGPRARRRRAEERRPSTRCRATASVRWPRAGWPRRRTRPTASRARRPPSDW